MELNTLIKGKVRSKKRVGRGIGSGKGGHTAGRGQKGQKSRKGNSKFTPGFEGGQVPLYKRLPTLRGVGNRPGYWILEVTLDKLNAFADGVVVTPKSLVEQKIIKRVPKGGIKIIGKGELTKKITLEGFLMSASIKEKLQPKAA